MNVKEWKLFPTLVMEVDDFLSDSECQLLFDHFMEEKKIHNHEKDYDSSYAALGKTLSSYIKDDRIYKRIDYKIIPDFYNRLKTCIDNYVDTVKFFPVRITNCWYNIQEKDSLLQHHTHSGSVISGAIYINVDEHSSKLEFVNPNPFPDFIEKRELSEYTYGKFSFIPQKGKMILFPSYLKHGAPNFNNTQNRCVISFNTEYER